MSTSPPRNDPGARLTGSNCPPHSSARSPPPGSGGARPDGAVSRYVFGYPDFQWKTQTLHCTPQGAGVSKPGGLTAQNDRQTLKNPRNLRSRAYASCIFYRVFAYAEAAPTQKQPTRTAYACSTGNPFLRLLRPEKKMREHTSRSKKVIPFKTNSGT